MLLHFISSPTLHREERYSFIYVAGSVCLMIWSSYGLIQMKKDLVAWLWFCHWCGVLSCKVIKPIFFCSTNDLLEFKITAFHWTTEFASSFCVLSFMFWSKHLSVFYLLWSSVNNILTVMKLRCKFEIERTAIYWREHMLCFASNGDTVQICWRTYFKYVHMCVLMGHYFDYGFYICYFMKVLITIGRYYIHFWTFALFCCSWMLN